jgi:hypothetical protein
MKRTYAAIAANNLFDRSTAKQAPNTDPREQPDSISAKVNLRFYPGDSSKNRIPIADNYCVYPIANNIVFASNHYEIPWKSELEARERTLSLSEKSGKTTSIV